MLLPRIACVDSSPHNRAVIGKANGIRRGSMGRQARIHANSLQALPIAVSRYFNGLDRFAIKKRDARRRERSEAIRGPRDAAQTLDAERSGGGRERRAIGA